MIPPCVSKRNQYSRRGVPLIGTRHLGMEFVTGRRRVPNPAESNSARKLSFQGNLLVRPISDLRSSGARGVFPNLPT